MKEDRLDVVANAPWQPIYTIERSGITEVSVYGIISVVEGTSNNSVRQLLQFGDVDYQLWSRSLLKPWQLLAHYDELKANFPALRSDHLALMMASHSAEPAHLKLLKEILAIGSVPDTLLKCPAAFPMSSDMKMRLKEQGEEPRSLYHNCSGKHLGYLLAMKSIGQNYADYLNADNEQCRLIKELLAASLHRDESTFIATIDGCQLPNYALSTFEMAKLYQQLAAGQPNSNKRSDKLAELSDLMRSHPQIIGGSDRFDSRLMSGLLTKIDEVPLIAKEGADGLLAVGIGPCKRYKNGLGMVIKLSSGNDSRHMETIIKELLKQLDLLVKKPAKSLIGPPVRSEHIKTNFNFDIALARVE